MVLKPLLVGLLLKLAWELMKNQTNLLLLLTMS